jgi:CHAT domain-containing protein
MRLDTPRWWLAAAGLAVAVAGGAWWISRTGGEMRSPWPHDPAVRLTVARLSVPSVHRPCLFELTEDRTLPRVTCAEGGRSARRDAIEASRRWMTNGAGDTSSAQREGVALLMVGKPEAAIIRLESALRNGRTSEILADLAAARIELALADDDPYELVKALDDLEKGSVQGMSMSMAYNRALVLGLLNLRGPALEAWEDVRDGEDDPAWRNDAESWLKRLSRPTETENWQLGANRLLAWLREGEGDVGVVMAIARRHPQHARILIEEEGFAAWAEAQSAREGADSIATRLVLLGKELALISGDTHLLRAAEAVASCDPPKCAALFRGHRKYTDARIMHEGRDYRSAESLFDESIAALSQGGTPFTFWPSFYRAVIISHRPDFVRATHELRILFDHPGAAGPVIQGYLHWMLGFVAARQSEHDTAVAQLEIARDRFRAAGEKENEQAMESLLGSIFDAVGQPEQAWRHHYRAFSLLGSTVKSRRIENTLSAAATGLRSRDEHAASLVLQEACEAQARRAENELGVALALRYKAEALVGLGKETEALRAVEEGLQWVRRIPDVRLRNDTKVHLLLTWAAVAHDDSAEALDRIEEAIAFAKHHHLNYLLPQAHATAAAVRRRLDDEDGERAALHFAVAEIDRQRAALTSEDDRIGFAAIARKVMEQGARSLSDRGEWAESFAFADRLRAMSLWDAIGPASPGARELPLGSLADGEAVLSYLVLSDRVLGWWVRRETVRGFQVAIERDVLDDLVARFRRAARENDERALQQIRRRLSDLLLSPVRTEFAGLDRLIVVPDGPLENLPFSALEADGRGYLIDSMAVTTVPAAAFYPVLSRRASGRSPPSR